MYKLMKQEKKKIPVYFYTQTVGSSFGNVCFAHKCSMSYFSTHCWSSVWSVGPSPNSQVLFPAVHFGATNGSKEAIVRRSHSEGSLTPARLF